MGWKVVQDVVAPRCTGKTMKVRKGQIFRVIEYEGKQVLDLNFINARNFREHYSAGLSAFLNSIQGMGGYYRLTRLYSKPPYENVMATVMDDRVGSGFRGGERAGHFVYDGHCSTRRAEFSGFPGARTCSDNFADAFGEIGIRQEDTWDATTFNPWMHSWVGEDGGMNFARPLAETGDYIDFLAEMDLVAVFSVCPEELQSPCNDYRAKALRFQIMEWDEGTRTMAVSRDLTEGTDITKPI